MVSTASEAGTTGPRAWPIVGQIPAFLNDKLGFLTGCARRYGDVVELQIGGRTFLLNRPADIGHVLVDNHSNYGKTTRLTSARGKRLVTSGLLSTTPATHGRQRRLLRPLFHRQTIGRFADIVVGNASRATDDWQGREVDIEAEMAELTRQNILAVLFSVDARGSEAWLAKAVAARQQYLEHVFGSVLPLPEYQPAPVNLRYRRAIRLIDEFLYAAIALRRSLPRPPDDLLTMLVQARYDDGTAMSDKEIRDEALTFSLTGYETVAEAMTWTLHLLSEHPRVADKVRQELDEVLRGALPETADLHRLPYLNAVFFESIRLYPPTWIQIRMALGDDRLPSGAHIAAGSKLYLCQWVTHRTERYFPHADHFDPDRFLPDAAPAHPKHAFFPFGLGPRRCLGENFAIMEAGLILATVLQQAVPTTASGQEITPHPGLILRPRDGLRMRVAPVG